MATLAQQRRILTGFGLSMGVTLTWLSLIVLVPLSALILRSFGKGAEYWW